MEINSSPLLPLLLYICLTCTKSHRWCIKVAYIEKVENDEKVKYGEKKLNIVKKIEYIEKVEYGEESLGNVNKV